MNKKGITEEILFLLGLTLIVLILFLLLFLLFSAGQTAYDNACKSIGYKTEVSGSYQEHFCVDGNRRVKVGFKNCGTTTCEVYKLGEEND